MLIYCIYSSYILYIQQLYTLQVHMSTSGIVIHYIKCVFQFLISLKYNFLNENLLSICAMFFRNATLTLNETYMY